jgi:hypothetical protein
MSINNYRDYQLDIMWRWSQYQHIQQAAAEVPGLAEPGPARRN